MTQDTKHFANLPIEKIFTELKTSPHGLTQAEVHERLERDGHNVITDKKEVGIILEFLAHFKNPLVLILMAAAAISGFLGEMSNFVIISIIILASVILNFFEEHSASNAAKKLKEKVFMTATAIRAGKKEEICARNICVGDVIFLSSGDLVPADAVLISCNDFFVNQSSLTGESFPLEKAPKNTQDALEDESHIIYLGSSVISGIATAVVFQTGQKTAFGSIAKSILSKEDKSGFELGVIHFGYFVMKVILALVLVIFLANSLINRDIFQSFMFALAIAVGITPELLPMVMSITMAYGAKKLSKAGVIVKRLSAILSLGSMDILCTDKTGTLTRDDIELVLSIDLFGVESEQVFLYTYLNSFHQTGVKNPLDKAILDFKTLDVEAYEKVEEIPFNFERKMMSVAVEGPGGRTLITKGTPENVLENCAGYQHDGVYKTMDNAAKKGAFSHFQRLSMEGYRVLAVAIKADIPKQEKYTAQDETNLTLVGFVGFLDPVKEGVHSVIESLNNYGVEVKIITGDNELVTQKICREVDITIKGVLLGKEIAALSDDALAIRAESTTIFARFSPSEKNRVINALRSRGHVIGYMGDGINDAPSLKAADVGISVDNAVDVAKETADIILTNKQLDSIIIGIQEGRKSFGNTMKYIMMGLSSNFGNMFSVLGAVFFLPFLPMLPIQILLNNLIYDFSQITIPTDNVDDDWISQPKKWNMHSIKRFMYTFGTISSLFDILTFFILFSVFQLGESAFQTGWFLQSLATQTLVVHVIRTHKIPFLQSRASTLLTVSTFGVVAVALAIPYSPLAGYFGFTPLPPFILAALMGIVLAYLCVVERVKRIYFKKYGV